MKLVVDRQISMPPYQQIVRQIRDVIRKRELAPHSSLPSARDIVSQTGVSLATAQRVLNELKSEGLIYSLPGKGSFIAQKKESLPQRIHLFLPSNRLSFFMEILSGIYKALDGKDIEIKMHTLNTDKLVWDWKTIEDLEKASQQGDAVLFIEEAFDSVRSTCMRVARQIPFVSLEWKLDGACSVLNDYEESTKRVMDYLFRDERKKSVLILKGRDYQYNAGEKLKGIQAKAKEFNLIENQSIFYLDTDFDAISGYEAVSGFLESGKKVDAIFCANDYEAIGVVGALTEKGLLPGKDIRLIGYGDMTDKTTLYFPLSTVKQDLFNMGKRGVELLLAQAAGEDVPQTEIIQTQFILRKT